MMVRRAEGLHPEGLADTNVVDVLCPAGHVADAVVAWEPCADGLHAGLPFGRTSGSPATGTGTLSTSGTSPRDAAMTASTIFT